MSTQTLHAYVGVLEDFKERFNANPRAKKLVVGWNRMILLEALDTQSRHTLTICDEILSEVRDATDDKSSVDADEVVHLQAEQQVLREIFSGKYNPATALTDGVLAVFSKERDKVKLEALAMVIWRLG